MDFTVYPGSRIARLIFASNLAGLIILIVGAMVLNEMRATFVVSKKTDLVGQAQLLSNLIGDEAAYGEPQPILDERLAKDVMASLSLPQSMRGKIYDLEGNLVGILSEMDCLRAVLGAVYNHGGIGTVSDYMASDNLVVAHPEEDIVDVAQDMLQKNKRRRPVVEDGKLVGQITCRALLSAVKEFRS